MDRGLRGRGVEVWARVFVDRSKVFRADACDMDKGAQDEIGVSWRAVRRTLAEMIVCVDLNS